MKLPPEGRRRRKARAEGEGKAGRMAFTLGRCRGGMWQHVPIMYVPRISQRSDSLLHQISQILDRRTWTTATATRTCTYHAAAAAANRWHEQTRRRQRSPSRDDGCGGKVGVQAPGVQFMRGGHCGHCTGMVVILVLAIATGNCCCCCCCFWVAEVGAAIALAGGS